MLLSCVVVVVKSSCSGAVFAIVAIGGVMSLGDGGTLTRTVGGTGDE